MYSILATNRSRKLIIYSSPYFFSRPTAVNLSDAATKLKEVISKAVATASEASSVFQVGYLHCF